MSLGWIRSGRVFVSDAGGWVDQEEPRWGPRKRCPEASDPPQNPNLQDCKDPKVPHVERGGIPHLAKNERDAPNFLHAAPNKTACAPFFKERLIKFIEATEPHRKSGMWGTRGLWRVGGFENQHGCKTSGFATRCKKAIVGAAPIVFGPRTPPRTWGTRPISSDVGHPRTIEGTLRPISFDLCHDAGRRYFWRRAFMTMASIAPDGVT
jgi:hypothetical protein